MKITISSPIKIVGEELFLQSNSVFIQQRNIAAGRNSNNLPLSWSIDCSEILYQSKSALIQTMKQIFLFNLLTEVIQLCLTQN